MKKAWNFVLTMWRPVLIGLACSAVLIGLIGFKLGSLTPGLAAAEIETATSSSSISAIYDNPINAPYKLLVFVLTSFGETSFTLRLASALMGAFSAVLFFLVARKLLGTYVGIATTVLFVTSSMFLHISRVSSPYIMLFTLLVLATAGYMLRFSNKHAAAWIICTILGGLSLYVPGMVLFVLAGVIWQFKQLRRSFEELPHWVLAVCGVLLIVFALPIIAAIFREPAIAADFIGLPAKMPELITTLKVIAYVPFSVFGSSPISPTFWLGRQPILDVIASVLFALGVYQIIRRPKLDRLWLLLGVFVLGTFWIALTGNHDNMPLVLPFIFLVTGAGIQYIVNEWQRVFPNNPLAKSTIIAFLVIGIGFSCNFQLNRYFIAWANSPDTEALFSQKITPSTDTKQ